MTSWLTINRGVHWYWATKHDENQRSTKRANWGWYCRFSGGYWGKSGRGGSSRFTFYWSSSARSVRTRNPPIRYGLAYTHASETGIQEPRGYSGAVSGPEKEQWLAAMALEVKSLEAMGTWNFVDRPQSRKVIPGRWVLAVKRDAMGQVERFKARYVVKGFMQVEGLDFNETFASTCKPETKRILLALGAQDDLVLHQMDVKSAFLNSPLAETMYMEQPEGFSSGDSQVCLLQRSLYGLRQAGRDWYQTLSTFLLDEGFTRRSNDFCLFTMRGTIQDGRQRHIVLIPGNARQAVTWDGNR